MGDAKGALALLDALPPAKTLLADKGHDAGWSREALEGMEFSACITARRGRKKPARLDRKLHKQRHRIETLFARLKDWRRIPPATTDAASCSYPPSASPRPSCSGCES